MSGHNKEVPSLDVNKLNSQIMKNDFKVIDDEVSKVNNSKIAVLEETNRRLKMKMIELVQGIETSRQKKGLNSDLNSTIGMSDETQK